VRAGGVGLLNRLRPFCLAAGTPRPAPNRSSGHRREFARDGWQAFLRRYVRHASRTGARR